MDSQVDVRLGDSILYRAPGEPGFTAHKAFLLFDEAAEGVLTIDSAKVAPRLKIRIGTVPKPSMNARVRTDPEVPGPQLEGEWRPMNGEPKVAGRYWLVDLQKVSK